MRLELFLCLLLFFVHSTASDVHSRKRRALAFPEGSSVSAAICCTIGVIGNPALEYMSWAVNWGVAYDLPNQTWARQNAHGFKNSLKHQKPIVLRRNRRDLYNKLEVAMDSMGFNGRDCILRALCESSRFFKRRTGNMVEELVKSVFSFPKYRIHDSEHGDVRDYAMAQSGLDEQARCEEEYPGCSFSLLELALGDYSVPPTKHGPVILPFM